MAGLVADLAPALELALRLIAEGERIPAYLCDGEPRTLGEVRRFQIGTGEVGHDGGTVTVHRAGVATCIAYDVGGRLITSTTTGMPCRVYPGAQCRVGPLTFGKDGVPHG